MVSEHAMDTYGIDGTDNDVDTVVSVAAQPATAEPDTLQPGGYIGHIAHPPEPEETAADPDLQSERATLSG